jgi:outer membrane protein assembly factor BamD
MQRRYQFFVVTAGVYAFFMLSGFGLFHHKKYETPITKETLQPDKILFDKAIKNIEKGNYEAARLTLNTLINTYDTSEYLAKAKLAIADSWFREGGAHGLAEAEAEYKDFILFYPNMEEAAESQYKICNIHYKQMDKADRDNSQAQRAEDECRAGLTSYPNSKFVPQEQQELRNVQEVLADKEFLTGAFYHEKGAFPAAANRLAFVTQQYPLYSGSDEALWELADSYKHMGSRFDNQRAAALTKLVQQYPLSSHLQASKGQLTAMNRPIPEADPEAYKRMKYELAARKKPGMLHRAISPFEGHPDTYLAAKTGAPIMTAIRPSVPVSVPAVAAGGQNGVSDVGVGVVGDSQSFDKAPDVRLGAQGGEQKPAPAQTASAAAPGVPAPAAPAGQGVGEQKASVESNDQTPSANAAEPPPTNHPLTKAQKKLLKKQQEKAAKLANKNGTPNNTATPAIVPASSVTPGVQPASTVNTGTLPGIGHQ